LVGQGFSKVQRELVSPMFQACFVGRRCGPLRLLLARNFVITIGANLSSGWRVYLIESAVPCSPTLESPARPMRGFLFARLIRRGSGCAEPID